MNVANEDNNIDFTLDATDNILLLIDIEQQFNNDLVLNINENTDFNFVNKIVDFNCLDTSDNILLPNYIKQQFQQSNKTINSRSTKALNLL